MSKMYRVMQNFDMTDADFIQDSLVDSPVMRERSAELARDLARSLATRDDDLHGILLDSSQDYSSSNTRPPIRIPGDAAIEDLKQMAFGIRASLLNAGPLRRTLLSGNFAAELVDFIPAVVARRAAVGGRGQR